MATGRKIALAGAEPADTRPGAERELSIRCPAKINLTLEVIGRYPDGYHQIASIMQTVSLADTLKIAPQRDVTFECDRPGLSGPDNLVVRAATLLKETAGYPGGARLRLQKRIPEAAGLGGGSSDAASALKGLNRFWNLGLSRRKLTDLAARIGSDVPFFLLGGTALAEGRGERIKRVQGPGLLWMVLIHPAIFLPEKTSTLYRALVPADYTSGQHTGFLIKAMERRAALPDDMLFNVFETVAPEVFPGLAEHIQRLRDAGASAVHLAGSGPTLFAIFRSRAEAESVLGRLGGAEAYLARTITASR